jgi:hypothetical protein
LGRLKVADIVAPMSFHNRVALDFPVSLGGYRNSRDPAEPMVLHMVHVPGAPNSGLDARAQFRAGRTKLFDMTFSDFEVKTSSFSTAFRKAAGATPSSFSAGGLPDLRLERSAQDQGTLRNNGPYRPAVRH